MLQFDKFFAKKSTMNTKGMSLLPRGSQGNMNYWPKSEDGVRGFFPLGNNDAFLTKIQNLINKEINKENILPPRFFKILGH